MRKIKPVVSLLLSVVLLIGCMSAVPLNANAAKAQNTVTSTTLANAADGELLVTFSGTVSDKKIEKTIGAEDAQVEDIAVVGDAKLAQVGVSEDIAQTAQALAENRNVLAVQPNYRYTVCEDDPMIGDESYAKNQYQFAATNAFAAWTALESGSHAKTKVAVIDTGVDLYHEDLQANMIKEDGKYAHYEYGDLSMAEDDFDADDGHGTHVSGIIGATYGNGIGGSGIASGHHNDLIELMTVSASPDGYALYTIDIIKAIEYAVSHGAKVVNMSFGSGVRDLAMDAAIQTAYYNNGVVFVAASGNEDYDGYSSPSDLKEVISINASNRYDEPTYYSNYGTQKDLLAPGNEILSTLPGDNYGNMSGTSMASPVAAGIAALVLDANPNLTPAQVYNILCASARQPEGITTAFNNNTGFGVIDAAAAVAAAKSARSTTAVSSIEMKSESISISVNETYGAEARVLPATSLKPITWSIADPTVATVNASTGIITGLKEGSTTVTATAGGKSISQTLKVTPEIALEDIELIDIGEHVELAVGEQLEINYKLIPDDATYTDIYVDSADENVAVGSDGVLIAKDYGTTTVTVRNWDGSVKKSFTLTVKNEAFEVVFTDTTDWLMLGDTYTFRAVSLDIFGEENVANGEVTFASSNKKVFTVDADTGVVTPVAVGKAYVIATNEASGEYAAKQVIIAKTNYGGADYALKQTGRTKTAIRLQWKSIPIASSYTIYRKESAGASWKAIKTVKSSVTTYTDSSKLSAGKVYYYCVRASYVKNGETKRFDASATILATTTPNYGLKQSAKTKTTITLKWNKVPSASGYVIQYKASKSAAWKTIKTVGAKTLSVKHTGLKAGKSAYYRILATYKDNGTVKYFDASAAITAKTAK